MLITKFLTFLTFVLILCLFGNVTFSDKPTPAEGTPTPAENAVFKVLREKYKNPILDEDFKTLKEITFSKTYLDFLKQEYPADKPFKVLEELSRLLRLPPKDTRTT